MAQISNNTLIGIVTRKMRKKKIKEKKKIGFFFFLGQESFFIGMKGSMSRKQGFKNYYVILKNNLLCGCSGGATLK